ncbi:uncharacterized protein LOC129171731 isoform X2 [Dunckerocampus dactyliophorus]|nr:uncharacterized protein LOC129171731 isoform X2 [Dunckerocampus dactyliophorus]XP_054616654.1 uncharacterized protein LOC129171731 isoform X2 [Dunckerocampus dactyliophorus]XP_054616655.1 uncharacterized protein LOC129171731 isoform X2 [Dunckerocampus dactyliophorus]
MTWRQAPYLCLIVFSSLMELSQENCEEYFTVKEWENTTELEMVDLAITENITNVAECTLERYCLQDQMCHVLKDCFHRDATEQSEKCKPVLNVTVHTYHLMCLVARVMNFKSAINGCEYESVCPLVKERRHVVSTTFVKTTMPSTTTAPSPTSPVMIAVTALSKPIGNSKHAESEASKSTYFLTLEILLVFVSSLAVVLPLAVYVYMRRQKRQDERWQRRCAKEKESHRRESESDHHKKVRKWRQRSTVGTIIKDKHYRMLVTSWIPCDPIRRSGRREWLSFQTSLGKYFKKVERPARHPQEY